MSVVLQHFRVAERVIYKVKARYRVDRLEEFRERLTDGSIADQRPDGQEIVSSMQRAKITQPGVIEWFETCYCPTPLRHERETVYDYYLSDIHTEAVEEYGELEGRSFWSLLQESGSTRH